MDRIKFIPLTLFCLYSIKLIVLGGISFHDAPILLILALTAGFYEYKANEKKIKVLEDKMSLQEKSIEELKTYVSSLKFSQQLRGVNK